MKLIADMTDEELKQYHADLWATYHTKLTTINTMKDVRTILGCIFYVQRRLKTLRDLREVIRT